MSIAKPFTFVANTHAKASEVNANFDTVYSQVNSNISAISQNAVDIENLENNKADINGSSSQRFGVADAVTDSDAINKRSLRASIANSIDYISGFTITKDSGSPNDTIIVSEGSCYDSTKTVVLSKANSTTKQNLNQGASATYYVYIIGNSTGSSVDILISESSTTPGLPGGYSLYRQIGYYTTDSDGNILAITSLSNSSLFNISSVMPDYKSRASRIWGTNYSEGVDGYVYLQTVALDDRGDHVIQVTFDGVSTEFSSAGNTTATEWFRYNLFVPVPKGATWTTSGDSLGVTLYWIPCIGV